MGTMRLLVHSAREVVRVGTKGQLYKTGADMNELNILVTEAGSTGLSVVVNQ